jgi:AraC-like DNA-binding protein
MVLANVFEELRITAALYADPEWYPIHNVPDVTAFELEHGVELRRARYNGRCSDRLRRDRESVLGEHAGFSDLFVPVGDRKRVWGMLAVGPFASARPTSGELLERWHDLTSRHAKVSDPSFARYVGATLGTLTLEGGLLGTFRTLMESIAALLGGQGDPARLGNEAARARIDLAHARFVERMWDAAETMVDDRTSHVWLSQNSFNTLAFLGLAELPEHVVAGLVVGREDEPDSIDAMLRRDAFQRGSADLARQVGGVVCARVGDHGVALLVDEAGSGRGSKLSSVAERASALARAHGFRLHVGISHPADAAPLAAKYRAALAGAEQALSLGRGVVHVGPAGPEEERGLHEMRRRLSQIVAEPTGMLAPRFDRYLEAVAVHSGYRLEPACAHLEAGLERIAETLTAAGALDAKSALDLYATMDRIALETVTVRGLFAGYRRLVADVDLALSRPTAAHRDRSTRRAEEYIKDHLGERLALAKVARVAGFAPTYFSRLFKREKGQTFEEFTRQRRVERAKQLLAGTSLAVERVGQLCGFGTRNYFHRVFKAEVKMTPVAYRMQSR